MSKTIILIKNQENITVTTYIELKENETNPDEQNCNTNQKSRKFQKYIKMTKGYLKTYKQGGSNILKLIKFQTLPFSCLGKNITVCACVCEMSKVVFVKFKSYENKPLYPLT